MTPHLIVCNGRATDGVRCSEGAGGRPSWIRVEERVLWRLAGVDVGVRVEVSLGDSVLRIIHVRRRSKVSRHGLGTEDGSVNANFLSIAARAGVAGRERVHSDVP